MWHESHFVKLWRDFSCISVFVRTPASVVVTENVFPCVFRWSARPRVTRVDRMTYSPSKPGSPNCVGRHAMEGTVESTLAVGNTLLIRDTNHPFCGFRKRRELRRPVHLIFCTILHVCVDTRHICKNRKFEWVSVNG